MHSPQYLQQVEVVSFINLEWNIQNEILSTLYILFTAHILDSLNDKKKETEINLMCLNHLVLITNASCFKSLFTTSQHLGVLSFAQKTL